MPSDPFRCGTIRHYSVLFLMVLFSSCGSKEGNTQILPQTNACLDAIGDRIDRYFDGTIEESEWVATFDCVADQVAFFNKYVRGEVPNGYTQKDIDAMVRKFLITDKGLAQAFVPALFEFKASLFGGEASVVTKEELQQFLDLNKVVRDESSALLPYLAARARNPSEANTVRFMDALQMFGDSLGQYFAARHGEHPVSKDSFLPFVREVIRLSNGDQTYVDKYGDVARHLKAIVGGGSSEVIESGVWSKLLREGSAVASVLLAFRDGEKRLVFGSKAEEYAYRLVMVKKGNEILDRLFAQNGGAIPLTKIDPVIDTVPLDGFSTDQREAIKKDLRPILFRTLKSGVVGYLTPEAVKNVLELYDAGMRSQIHIHKIFADLPPTVVPREFEAAAERYKATINSGTNEKTAADKARVDQLISIAKTFQGQFPQGSGEIRFSPDTQNTRSLSHMNRMQWFQKAIHYAFSIYATEHQSSSVREAKSSDLETLTGDFENILKAWRKVRPGITRAEVASKRFREGNLFMPISNGDKLLNETETTYYISYLFSSGAMASRVFEQIVDKMRLCQAGNGLIDETGNPAVEAKCFRNAYFSNIDIFWNNFPELIAEYKRLRPSEQAAMQYSMEKAARTKGVSDAPIGPFDMDSFAALPHYLESIIQRFDVNNDQVLDKREVLDRAYPVFRDTLSTISGRTSDWVLQGALTYVMKFGKMPKTLAEQAHFLAWCAWRPFWKISADRAALYQVIAILSEPIPKKPRREDMLLPSYSEEELAASNLAQID